MKAMRDMVKERMVGRRGKTDGMRVRQKRNRMRVATGVGEVDETREGLEGAERGPFYTFDGAFMVFSARRPEKFACSSLQCGFGLPVNCRMSVSVVPDRWAGAHDVSGGSTPKREEHFRVSDRCPASPVPGT